MAADRSSPLTVTGAPGQPLSRWLWLVKWLLAIPHFVLLAFLWITYAVLTVIAFFAILFTGRYPRVIFEFNRGVLRWSWRVTFYSYGVLGTDMYPPFTLGAAPGYPAALDIERPGPLSRGLVLIKWWLLAIPHYLVVAIFTGGGADVDDEGRRGPAYAEAEYGEYGGDGLEGGPGLIFLLVLFAAVALLVTARYPRGIFDLVMGMNRWQLRVVAYATLMTDTYPPFRLDQGGEEGDRPSVREPSSPGGPWPGTAIALAVPGAFLTFAGLLAGIVGGVGGGGDDPSGRMMELGLQAALVTGLVMLVVGAIMVAAGLLVASRALPDDPDPARTPPPHPDDESAHPSTTPGQGDDPSPPST